MNCQQAYAAHGCIGTAVSVHTGPITYTIDRHALSKRLFALQWQAGEVTGIAGPFLEAPAEADLPGLHYDHNKTVLRHVTTDILAKRYVQVEVTEVAS